LAIRWEMSETHHLTNAEKRLGVRRDRPLGIDSAYLIY
jgi:hypothetical protein